MPEPAKAARSKKDLVEGLARSGSRLGGGLLSFHQALAARLGLNETDCRCLELARDEPAGITPGRLAELTGLTTGAITAALDRLDRAGFLRRERDAVDRRKVIVRVLPKASEKLDSLLAGLVGAMRSLHEGYTTDQLALLLDYQAAWIAVLAGQSNALDGDPGRG